MELLNNLNKDEVYKKYFVEYKGKSKVTKFNDKRIPEIKLNTGNDIRATVFLYLLEKFNVNYNLNDTEKLISFASLRGLYSQDE